MPRYIDADALRKQISETYEYEFPTASGGFDEFATKIIPNIINNAITADVVPVVRGEWKTWEEQFPGRTTRKKNNLGVFCSACQLHADNMTRYCPNCGAKMEDKS